jgi:HPt (histidine-containing phosphotransfer) domain-containing protein
MLYSHRLRGSALTIGIDILADAAGKIEIAAQENDLIRADSLVDDLRSEYQRTTDFLQRDDWVEISMAGSSQKVATGKRSDDSSCNS